MNYYKKILFILLTFILLTVSCCTVEAAGVSNNSEITQRSDSSDVIAVLSTYTYETTGIVRTPSVTVADANGIDLKEGMDYTVSYDKGRIKPGKYNVIVTLMGNYSGNINLSFTIKGNSGNVNQSGRWFYEYKKIKGKKVRVKTSYQYEDGTYPVGTAKIGNQYYYFQETEGKLAKSSKKQRICTSDGLKFDVASDGTLKKGWQVVNNKLYYFGESYQSAATNKKVDGIKLTKDGWAKKLWTRLSKKKQYSCWIPLLIGMHQRKPS